MGIQCSGMVSRCCSSSSALHRVSPHPCHALLLLRLTAVLCDGITDFLAPACDFIVDHACSYVSDELRKHIPNTDICDHIHLC